MARYIMRKLVIGIFAAALGAAPIAFADDHHDADHHDSDHHGAMSGGMMGMPMRHHSWHHGDTLPRDYWHANEVDWHRYANSVLKCAADCGGDDLMW